MDAVIFMLLALVLTIKYSRPDAVSKLDETIMSESDPSGRVAKLNELFYEDDDAFSEIIHALGFPKEGQL